MQPNGPAHRGEGRLLAATYQQLTAAPVGDDLKLDAEGNEIKNLLSEAFLAGYDNIAIVTDGGADLSLAAWAVATAGGTAAGSLLGEDTSSMAAELGAIYRTLRAIEAFVHCPLPVSSAGPRSAASLAFCALRTLSLSHKGFVRQ